MSDIKLGFKKKEFVLPIEMPMANCAQRDELDGRRLNPGGGGEIFPRLP